MILMRKVGELCISRQSASPIITVVIGIDLTSRSGKGCSKRELISG